MTQAALHTVQSPSYPAPFHGVMYCTALFSRFRARQTDKDNVLNAVQGTIKSERVSFFICVLKVRRRGLQRIETSKQSLSRVLTWQHVCWWPRLPGGSIVYEEAQQQTAADEWSIAVLQLPPSDTYLGIDGHEKNGSISNTVGTERKGKSLVCLVVFIQ